MRLIQIALRCRAAAALPLLPLWLGSVKTRGGRWLA